jgi:hypothetical protein
MKKFSLSLFFSIAFLSLVNAQVIITEIMYNPPESGNDSLEYFEIYNNSNAAVDISGWNFTQGIVHTFPANTIMPANSYITLAKNANAFQLVFGFQPTLWDNPGDALSNGGEDIELADAQGNVIDRVDYTNAAPWPLEANGGGSSLVLCDYNGDNAAAGNWAAATTGTGVMVNAKEVFGNPNAASGCQNAGTIVANADNFVAPSGQTTLLDVLFNDQFVGTVTSFEITTGPTSGTASVVGNRISYTPDQGYCGTDQLEYKVCNAGSCGTAIASIAVRCYPQRSIQSVTVENADGVADSLMVACELTGVVYGYNIRPTTGTFSSTLFTIIDAQGNGISVSHLSNNFGYNVQEKDQVTVRGTIGQFNGMTEIRPDTIIKLTSGNTLLAPATVNNISETTESKLVKINNLMLVDPAEWTTGSGSSGFNVRAVSSTNPQDTILIRIDRDVETYNAPVPPQPFNLTGIGGQFDGTSPFTSGYQVLPRYNADINTLVGVKTVDFSHLVKLSPNPTSDMLTIEMNSGFDRVSIISGDGRIIKTLHQPDTTYKVNVSLLSKGSYFVRFEKAGASWTTKFIKK